MFIASNFLFRLPNFFFCFVATKYGKQLCKKKKTFIASHCFVSNFLFRLLFLFILLLSKNEEYDDGMRRDDKFVLNFQSRFYLGHYKDLRTVRLKLSWSSESAC